jgi:hypothetical protein
VTLDQADLHTESFSNSKGWTAVRVTHTPSSTSVERSRSTELQSPVQAQKECMEEIERLLGQRPAGQSPVSGSPDDAAPVVARAEFDALVVRVTALERARDSGP